MKQEFGGFFLGVFFVLFCFFCFFGRMFSTVFWLKEFFYLSIPYLSRGHVSKGKPPNASEFISSINKTLAVQKFSWDILASELNKWKFRIAWGCHAWSYSVCMCAKTWAGVCWFVFATVYYLTFPFNFLLGWGEMTISAKDCICSSE